MDLKTYRINNHDLRDPFREVLASARDAKLLEEQGYLVRERLLDEQEVEKLRDAIDTLAEQEGSADAAAAEDASNFGGLFIRHAIERDDRIWDLAQDPRLLDLARYMLGPQVQVHASVLRITYPGQPNQETHWHFHQRVAPDPLPPFFAYPRVLDNLIYLDDLDEETGPLCVIPASHRDITKELPAGIKDDLPGQVKLCVPAGSCVTADAALWHRGMATTPKGRVRRLLILGYSPTWMKPIDPPGAEFLARFPRGVHDELLGRTGYY